MPPHSPAKYLEGYARAGGHTRAARYPKEWQALLMRFCTLRRLKKTRIRSFSHWLVEEGLQDGLNVRSK